MGKRGPRPKSAELESKQGFPGRRKSRVMASLAPANDSADASEDDIQDDNRDSLFVQPPSYLGKRDRAVWAEIFAGPNAKLWYKFSDHNVIARYCSMTVMMRRIMQTPPKPTYEVTRTPPPTDACAKPVVLEKMIKRNPEFDQMLALSREMRSIEKDVGMNPDARLTMVRKGLAPGNNPGGDQKPSQSGAGKPAGPVGILKSAAKMN